jgi:hypothetical protein
MLAAAMQSPPHCFVQLLVAICAAEVLNYDMEPF